MAYYLVNIAPVDGTDAKLPKILSTVEKTVLKHTSKETLRFKVFGENKIGFIAKGDEPQKVLDDLNSHLGGLIDVKTIPIRSYETFAQDVLGVDSTICEPKTMAFVNPQKIFFVQATIDFPGIGMEELIKIWKEEATAGLQGRHQGQLDYRCFKTVATRKVLLIFNVPAAEVIDAAVHTLPFAMNPKTSNGFQFPVVKELKPF